VLNNIYFQHNQTIALFYLRSHIYVDKNTLKGKFHFIRNLITKLAVMSIGVMSVKRADVKTGIKIIIKCHEEPQHNEYNYIDHGYI